MSKVADYLETKRLYQVACASYKQANSDRKACVIAVSVALERKRLVTAEFRVTQATAKLASERVNMTELVMIEAESLLKSAEIDYAMGEV